MNSNMDAIPQAIALANKTGAVAMQNSDLCDWNQSNRYDLRTDRNLYQYVVSSIRRYRCCILMYFEFDPNFTSEVIQKNIRLQFDRRETGNKYKISAYTKAWRYCICRNCTQIKKWEIAEFIFIAIVGNAASFVYDWSGQNPAVGIIAPVSEYMGTFKAALYAGTFIYTDPGGSDWQRLSVSIDAKSKSRLSGYGGSS